MALSGIAECLLGLGCLRWAFHRCLLAGSDDSHSWSPASLADFSPFPHALRAIHFLYEPPSADVRLDTGRHCPPYILFPDPTAGEVVLAIRGLNLLRESDYELLLDDSPGLQPLYGGYVHHGLWKAAAWVVNREAKEISRLLKDLGLGARLVLAGHSLGAGVAALMSLLVVNQLEMFGGLERSRVRCYAVAPPRCMSLNLAVLYSDVIHSVVLQDDFLPRMPMSLQQAFGSICCLPCSLCITCMRDTFLSDDKRNLKDPKRLYAPGRIFHIVDRKLCRCGRYPPEVRTAVPVEGRFEQLILSCSTISDHSLFTIEQEAQKALDRMEKEDQVATTVPPKLQRIEKPHSSKAEAGNAREPLITKNEELAGAVIAVPSSRQEVERWCISLRENTGGSLLVKKIWLDKN